MRDEPTKSRARRERERTTRKDQDGPGGEQTCARRTPALLPYFFSQRRHCPLFATIEMLFRVLCRHVHEKDSGSTLRNARMLRKSLPRWIGSPHRHRGASSWLFPVSRCDSFCVPSRLPVTKNNSAYRRKPAHIASSSFRSSSSLLSSIYPF